MFTYRPRLKTPEQVQETAQPQMRAKTQVELAEQAPKKKKRRRRRRRK
jgi:hypothetical protein